MPKNLSSHDEQLLLSGVQRAVQLVDDDGYSPNDALAKIAKDMNFTPGMLRTACFAYNTGRQLSQWKSNDNILDKVASFPLADFEVASAAVFSPQTKVAEYVPPLSVPLRTYQSSILPASSHRVMSEKAAQDAIQKLVFDAPPRERTLAQATQHLEQSRLEKFAAETQLEEALTELVRYFRKSAYDRKPLAQVEWFSQLRHPGTNVAIFDYVCTAFPKEKRAAAYSLTWEKFGEAVDYTAEPYAQIDRIVQLIPRTLQAGAAYEAAQKQAADAAERTYGPALDKAFPRPVVDTLLGPTEIPSQKEKVATIGVTDVLSFMAGQRLADKPKDNFAQKQEQILDKANEFVDPSQVDELRKIRAQTALSQLMSDADDPLSEADPGHVLSAYNSLVHMAPRLADQPEALGPLLRRRIVGRPEPFEASEVLKFEEGLRKTQAPALSANDMFSGGMRS